MPEPTIAEMTAFVAVHGMGYHEPVEVCDYTVWIDSDEIEHFFDPATVPADRDALVEAMEGLGWTWYLGSPLTAATKRMVFRKGLTSVVARDGKTGAAVLTAAFKALKGETDG